MPQISTKGLLTKISNEYKDLVKAKGKLQSLEAKFNQDKAEIQKGNDEIINSMFEYVERKHPGSTVKLPTQKGVRYGFKKLQVEINDKCPVDRIYRNWIGKVITIKPQPYLFYENPTKLNKKPHIILIGECEASAVSCSLNPITACKIDIEHINFIQENELKTKIENVEKTQSKLSKLSVVK